jgi:hypothetical protein
LRRRKRAAMKNPPDISDCWDSSPLPPPQHSEMSGGFFIAALFFFLNSQRCLVGSSILSLNKSVRNILLFLPNLYLWHLHQKR